MSRVPRFRPAWWLHAPLVAILLLALLFGGGPEREIYPLDHILCAIWLVESGGRLDPPDGDGGRAIGPLQIHRAYFQDAVAHDEDLDARYEDCRDPSVAVRVMRAYMLRWVPEAWHAGHAEILARVHNGGPRGATKRATLGYWRKVRSHLRRMSP